MIGPIGWRAVAAVGYGIVGTGVLIALPPGPPLSLPFLIAAGVHWFVAIKIADDRDRYPIESTVSAQASASSVGEPAT